MAATAIVLLLGLGFGQQEAARAQAAEIERLQLRLARLEATLRERDEALAALTGDVRGLADAVRTRPVLSMAAPFLTAPPAASDLVGIAKSAVFAPRLMVDGRFRHDLIVVRLRRIEHDEAPVIQEAELTQDMKDLELRIDRSGALYALEWTTSEGQAYSLALRDGATELPAATAQVKPQDARGRFLFVGYRLE